MARSRSRAPGPGRASTEQTPEPLSVLSFHLTQRPFEDFPLGDEHEIEGVSTLARVQPEGFPQEPLRPVAVDGTAQLARCGEAQPVVAPLVHRRHEREEWTVQAHAAAEDIAKLGPGEESLPGAEPAPDAAGHPVRPRSACAPSAGAA
jgi:hypothetical protein